MSKTERLVLQSSASQWLTLSKNGGLLKEVDQGMGSGLERPGRPRSFVANLISRLFSE